MCLLYTELLQSFILLFLTFPNIPHLCLKVENNEGIRNEDNPHKIKRDCCHTNPPSFEIKAILIPCSLSYCPCSIPGQPSTSKAPDFDCQTGNTNGRLSNFTKKLIITVRMTNVGKTQCKKQYVVVDHVYDPTSEHKQRLLYPYVLKISQKPIMQTYNLEKESSVNEKSTELVINKNNRGYKGCKTTGDDTTCPKVTYNDKPIPYSTGFCCSCKDKGLKQYKPTYDEEVEKFLDIKKYDEENCQPTNTDVVDKRGVSTRVPIISSSTKGQGMSDTTIRSLGTLISSRTASGDNYLKDQIMDLEKALESFDVNDFEPVVGSKYKKRMKRSSEIDNPYSPSYTDYTQKSKTNYLQEDDLIQKEKVFDEKIANECEEISRNLSEVVKNDEISARRDSQISSSKNRLYNYYFHPRGGQNCSNKTYPPDVDPERYHQSTHCLVFSKLWYTVYKLSKPMVFHEVTIEIFEKHEDLTGHVIWHDITKGKPLTVGTTKPEDIDKNEEVWAGYMSQEPPPHAFGLDPDVHRLLIPEPVDHPWAARMYPELRGGPYEWLVIPNYMITYDGNRCDKVGVGYEAFVKQPNRCNMPRGTCLRNQPKDLWCHDHRLEEVGQFGSYFLKYFGFLPKYPLRNTSDATQNLTMYFRSAHMNTINIEFKTDYNLVLRPHAAAVITEVYVDSTNYIKSTITVKITNTGLVYGIFYVALTDCPLDMPASFNNIQTKSAVIHPQHQHNFVIEIMCSLPEKKFYCSIEAKNIKNELLAFRRIRFQKDDRCLCIWHCVCTCIEADGGLQCQPLPFDHYNAAGFHGGLPMVADFVQFTLIEELMTILYHLFLTMTLILILMGVLKGFVGIYYQPIGEWGLCSILGLPKPMKTYHEKSLRDREVIYDKGGWPIHPDTKKRVRNASMIVEFCINTVFFLIYPLVMINVIVRRMCFVDSTDESDNNPCCLCGQIHQAGECPSLGILRNFVLAKQPIKKEGEGCCICPRRDASSQYSRPDSCECTCY